IAAHADDLVRMHRRQQLRLRQRYPLRRNEIRNDGADGISIMRRHAQHHRYHVPPIHRLDEPVMHPLPQPEPAIPHGFGRILHETFFSVAISLGTSRFVPSEARNPYDWEEKTAEPSSPCPPK